MNTKSAIDKFVISPVAAAATAYVLTAATIGNVGYVDILGKQLPPAAAVAVCVAAGSLVAGAVEDPIKESPVFKSYGDTAEMIAVPTITGIAGLAAMTVWIGNPRTPTSVLKLFMLSALSQVGGDYAGALVKSAM
jgi:hypothetical protein